MLDSGPESVVKVECHVPIYKFVFGFGFRGGS